MLPKANPSPADFAARVAQDGWELAWEGLIFVPGYRAGKQSAQALLSRMIEQGVGPASCVARGTYWLCVRPPDGHVHHLVDPCGMMRIFVTPQAVFGRYIDALSSLGVTLESCDPDGLIEFLNYGRFGANYSHHTGVTSLRGCDRVEVDAQGKLHLRDRGLPDPMVHTGVGVARGFEDLAHALQGLSVAVDLTGGMDSRLIAACLHQHGLPFVTGLSGGDHYTEFAMAEAVAKVLDRPFIRYGHDLARLDEDLRRHARLSEGLMDVVATHRARCMQEARVAAGIEVGIGGMGGEMINDFPLLQDLPRLGRREPDLERFWRLRLLPVVLPKPLLSSAFQAHQDGLRTRMLSRLESYRRESAASTYLNIFYAHRMSAAAGPQLTTGWQMGLCELAPFMDYDLYGGTYDLPLGERLASRHHRRHIRGAAPALAGLPSSTGMRAYSGALGELRDLLGFGRQLAYRALRKAEQKVRRRRLRQESPDYPELHAKVRLTPAARSAFERVQQAGILAPELSLDELPNLWLGKVVSLGLFAQELDEASRSATMAVPAAPSP